MSRCMAVVGAVWTGPQYCGFRTTSYDRNGRPCCKRHLDQQLGIEWFGERGNYPHGVGGSWQWRHGEFRNTGATS